MIPKRLIMPILLGVLSIFPFCVLAATNPVTSNAISRSKYTRAHSLGDNYNFDARDGWKTVNVTNLEYKYRRNAGFANSSLEIEHKKRDNDDEKDEKDERKKPSKPKLGLGNLGGVIANVWAGLKGIGKPETATITW